jgi:hypothetical protein
MWGYKSKQINPRCFQYQLLEEEQVLRFERVLELWQSSPAFRVFYNRLLADHSFAAYFWEHPPLTISNLDQPYEFVLINSHSLAGVSAEPAVFAEYFTKKKLAVSFPNLRADAQLVVPEPFQELAYPHLASFCRQAPIAQVHDFWALAGTVVAEQLSAAPRWLSTSGLGVYWLHLRLDKRPKYYNYDAYKSS